MVTRMKNVGLAIALGFFMPWAASADCTIYEGNSSCSSLATAQQEFPYYSQEVVDEGQSGGLAWATYRACYDAECTVSDSYSYSWNASSGEIYLCSACEN